MPGTDYELGPDTLHIGDIVYARHETIPNGFLAKSGDWLGVFFAIEKFQKKQP